MREVVFQARATVGVVVVSGLFYGEIGVANMVDESAAKGGQESASSPPEHYHVNFFQPGNDHSRANMKMIIVMVLIWAVGVFGFQIALMVMGKKVPEPTLSKYEKVWPEIQNGSATSQTKQEYARTLLMVLGKNIAVSDGDKNVLKQALSSTTYELAENQSAELDKYTSTLAAEYAKVHKENEKEASLDQEEEKLNPETVADMKGKIRELGGSVLNLTDKGYDPLLSALLPDSLLPAEEAKFIPAENGDALTGIMKKYLIHNRCALTDTKFMGFPFHYWYTAQFLLIMFVALCWIYTMVTDRLHKKYGFVEE